MTAAATSQKLGRSARGGGGHRSISLGQRLDSFQPEVSMIHTVVVTQFSKMLTNLLAILNEAEKFAGQVGDALAAGGVVR